MTYETSLQGRGQNARMVHHPWDASLGLLPLFKVEEITMIVGSREGEPKGFIQADCQRLGARTRMPSTAH